MRRTTTLLAALLALSLLAGCLPKGKDWTHPRIADPRKEDRQFLEDTEFCKTKAGAQGDTQPGSPAMADCYRRLGWKPVDKD